MNLSPPLGGDSCIDSQINDACLCILTTGVPEEECLHWSSRFVKIDMPRSSHVMFTIF